MEKLPNLEVNVQDWKIKILKWFFYLLVSALAIFLLLWLFTSINFFGKFIGLSWYRYFKYIDLVALLFFIPFTWVAAQYADKMKWAIRSIVLKLVNNRFTKNESSKELDSSLIFDNLPCEFFIQLEKNSVSLTSPELLRIFFLTRQSTNYVLDKIRENETYKYDFNKLVTTAISRLEELRKENSLDDVMSIFDDLEDLLNERISTEETKDNIQLLPKTDNSELQLPENSPTE